MYDNSTFWRLSGKVRFIGELSSVSVLVLGLVVNLRSGIWSRAHVLTEMLSETLDLLHQHRIVFKNVTEIKFLKLPIS